MTTIKTAATAGILLAAFAAAPVSAQTINAFTTQNVSQALTAIGATGVEAGRSSGSKLTA